MKNRMDTKENLELEIGWMRYSLNDIMKVEDLEKRKLLLKEYRHFLHQISPLFTKLRLNKKQIEKYNLFFDENTKVADIFKNVYKVKSDITSKKR